MTGTGMNNNNNNSTPNPITLEWFKNNCTILENALAPDFSDPINDLVLLESWIEWAESPHAPPDCVGYFYEVTLLKIVNSLLTKKYQNVEQHTIRAKHSLVRIAETLGRQFSILPEFVTEILLVLFNQKHPFYLKYGYPKIAKPIEGTTSKPSEDFSWVATLAVGDCIDGKSPGGDWEIVIIDEVSPVGTEINVSWSSGVSEWLRLEDSTRIAKFGTKTGVYSDPVSTEHLVSPPVLESAPQVVDISAVDGKVECSNLTSEEDTKWKDSLSVGDLIDAKDKSGTWYQACILEFARMESICSSLQVTPDQAVSQEGPTPQTPSDDQNTVALKKELFSTKNPTSQDVDDTVNPNSIKAEIESGDISPPTVITSTFVRVCYLGWLEYYDDWVELSAATGRIAPLNSQSFGTRGENLVREEVKNLAKFWEKKNECRDPSRQLYADSACHVLVSPFYAEVVNRFFVFGFPHLTVILSQFLVGNIDLKKHFHHRLILAIGLSAEVLSNYFLSSSCDESDIFSTLISYIERYIGYLLREDLRATKTETIEQLIVSLERILKGGGRNIFEVYNLLDPIWLDVASECIRCPFLNRRLGGLKILTDMLHRYEQSILYPRLLRITRSAPPSTSSSSVSSSNTTTSASYLSMTSYTFIPPCTIDSNRLCKFILEILPYNFVGETAHEALMQRSNEMLKFLCKHNSFSPSLLKMLWDLGSNSNNLVVLQIIQELVPISFSLEILELLVNQIVLIPPTSVTIQIADILNATTLRCRSLLLEIPQAPVANPLAPIVVYSHDISAEDDEEENLPVINLFLAQDLHRICLSSLFSWAEDGSNVNDSVALKCISKIEGVLDLGINQSIVVQAGNNFPWIRHWQRGIGTLLRALDCLRHHRSILLSVKTIRAFILSWTKEDDYIKAKINLDVNNRAEELIPVDYFYRNHIAQYIEGQYQLLKIVTDVIVNLKNRFNVAAKGIISESSSEFNSYKLSTELQAVLNELMIDSARTGYKDQLEILFDFIQFLVRSSTSIRLDFLTIQLIWQNVLLMAVTPQERDLVFSFINRLIVNRSTLASLVTSGDTESKEPEVLNPEANIPQAFGRLTFFHPDTVQLIYNNLLSQNEFIMSDHFSSAAFLSVEKYYKWICASNNSIVELPGKDGGFVILKSLSTQSEWEIFPKIVMYCRDDKVALDAVKFLSMFPQRLSQTLVYAGDVVALRELILSRSMTELEDIRDKAIGSDNLISNHDLSSKLKRTLMLLNSLIDESSADASKRVKSHSGKWRSKPISVKIQYPKMTNMVLTFDSSDTIDDLLSGISRALSKDIQTLKFFRRGTELALNNVIKKTLQQIDILVNETIVVVDRPANSVANYAPNPPYLCPLETLPSVILSNTPKYLDILFSLLDVTSGTVCDDIWELIIRLPTSPNALRYWKEMIQTTTTLSPDTNPNSSNQLNFFSLNSNCESSDLLVEDSSGKRMKITRSISRLIYNLQIIETFFHSTKLEKSQSNNSPKVEDLDYNPGDDSEDDEGLWMGMFITNGGIHSLEDVLSYVIQQCTLFCDSHGCVGMTPKLLLCGMNLITKIFRGYLIRGIVCSRPKYFQEVQFLVKSILNNLEIQNSTPDETSVNDSPKENEDNSQSQYLLDVPEAVDVNLMTIEQAQTARIDAVIEREDFISNEWGNKLNPHFDVSDPSSSSELINSTLNLKEIQSLMYQFILIVPKFTSESFFYCGNTQQSHLISVRDAIQQTQNEYLQCVRNTFVIWGSVMVFNPDLALDISDENVEDDGIQFESKSITIRRLTGKKLLAQLLLGFPTLPFSNESLNRFPSVVSGTSLLGLLIVMKLSERCLENNEFYLRNIFFHVLLDLRPSLTFSQSQNTNCESLFSFVTYLLSFESILKLTKFPPDIKFNMEETKLLEICQNIFQEMIEVGNTIKVPEGVQPSWSGKDRREISVPYLGGTMKMLRNLMKINHRSVDSLLPLGIVDYLIDICLGIRSTQSISLNVLCHDAETRLQAYQILALFFTNFDITSNIMSQMNIAHGSLEEPSQWSFNPVRDVRSSVGYIGLKNMGCTCYMNSLLQILYMNPIIRTTVASAIDPIDQSEESLKDNLLYQLKKMFQFLLHSTRKAYLPDGWMFAYKDETGQVPVNVLNQQDAQEFLQVFCERMERHLVTQSSEGSTSLLNSLYSVQICDQVIKQIPDPQSEDRSLSVREKNDTMMCISLDVRGTSGLENSLKKFVSGESISDYLWDENQPRVNIIKRQCIGKLSDSVIFHLKRFELNFDTFLREKVNDEFPFPMHLDLFPYTKEGLEGQSRTTSEYFYELSGIVVHTGTTDSGHYYSYIKESRDDARDRYLREHNLSIIPPNTDIPRRWIEFNDSEVQLFSETRIPGECFGGSMTQHEYIVSSQTWLTNNTPNPKSAYMLVYQKSSHHHPEKLNEPKIDESSDMELSPPATEYNLPPESVVLDNQSHLLSSRCFTREHIEFMILLEEHYLSLHNMCGCTFEEFLVAAPTVRTNLCDFLSFLTRFVSRSLYQSAFESGCELIANLLDNLILMSQTPQNNQPSYSDILKNQFSQSTPISPTLLNTPEFNQIRLDFCVEICQSLLSNLMNHQGGLFLQNIIFAPDKKIRGTVVKLIFKLLVILINFERDSDLKIKNLSNTILKFEILSPFHVSDLSPSMRDEIDSIPLLPLYLQFLLMITKNSYFLMCGEQWRRADGFMWLLYQISQVRPSLRIFMIRREVILQLVDLFLGDHSPLAGEYYIKGSRKRAPTSYVTIVPGKDGKLPSTAQNTPDWTDLLKTLSALVRSTLTPNMIRMGSPPTLLVGRNEAHVLDQTTCHLLQSKIFYTHALRQQRYISPIGDIICHLCYEDRLFSNESITDVITEGLSYATLESIAQYFELIEMFVSINDTLSHQRAMVLFDSPNGAILQIIRNYQQNKPQFVCITIESLFSLVHRSRTVSYFFRNKLSDWAPWILKFCYQYVEKTSKEIQQTSSTSTSTATESKVTELKGNETDNQKKKKGPYLRVFGESEEDRELNNAERASRTFEFVQQVMRNDLGAHPDAYIPIDAFDVLPVETDEIPAETIARILDEEEKSSIGVNTSVAMLSDAMTDEEFARYLSQTLD